jgi:hypothetical protein
MENEKVFLGRVKKVITKNGNITKISFGQKDLDILKSNMNEQGWSNWNLKESMSGNLYIELDTWKPMGKEINQNAVAAMKSNQLNQKTDDLPF